MNSYLFSAHTCLPKALTFGTIYYCGGLTEETASKYPQFESLPSQDLNTIKYGRAITFIVIASTLKEAYAKLRATNPGLSEIGRPKRWRDKQAKYWSYSR